MNTYHKKTTIFLHQGLFDSVSSFKEFERRMENLDSKQDKGDAFEVFAQAYLATQKIVQAKTVWAFDDIPQKIRSNLSIDTHIDMGVDGVFEMNTGEQCAYQVKFRTGRPYLTWTELSTFMGLTEQADKRVLFTNCDDIPDLMNDRSDFYCIRGSDLDRLEAADFSAIKSWLEGVQVEFKQYDPLPHQINALQKIESAFKVADRATVIMACGTGKTLVQLWASEMLNVNSVLVLVPSLALIRQTLHEWLKQTKWEQFSYMCVCSDPSVAKSSDEVIVKQSELDFPVTTSSVEVARYLNTDTNGPHIVFSTYQSAHAVADGMPSNYKFDLAFFDEAHKTAGRSGTKFAFALDDGNLSISKRLFMTATPRHYDVQKKDKEGDSKLVYSMDVPEIYGETVYSLQFRDAVNDDLICDYKVLISVVTDEAIDDWQLSHGEVVVKGDEVKARQVANQIALRNAVEEYGVHRIFTFHKSVASAKSFTSEGGEGINTELPNFVAVHVNGAMTAAKRSHIMREFAEADQAVISNARCLTEGVDVPAVDMVAFLSPKKSKVDIVQATGRAMRKSPGKGVGYVFVPLYLEQEKDESLEEALERTDFSEIWNVLQAMKEQDEDLADVIREVQQERGKTGGYNDSRLREHLEVLGPALNLATLRNAINTQCIERLGDNWDRMFGQLEAYKEEHGDCNVLRSYPDNPQLSTWVSVQRKTFNKGDLNYSRVRRLGDIGFVLDPLGAVWEKKFLELKAFGSKYGHCNASRYHENYLENPQLVIWVSTQRALYKKGNMMVERVHRLEEIGFVWDVTVANWENWFSELKAYKDKYGDCNVPQSYKENPRLGSWVSGQRINYKNDMLGIDHERRLEEIGFIWDYKDASWKGKYLELIAYKELYGNCNVPNGYKENLQLAMWVSNQRKNYNEGLLDDERIHLLGSLGFQWNPYAEAWEERYLELKAYKYKYGDCNVTQRSKNFKILGQWVQRQRQFYKKGKLNADQVLRLEELGFVWDPLRAAWVERYLELGAFRERYGHCGVTLSYMALPKLGAWVRNQRIAYRKGKLVLEQIRLLEELGFDWNPSEKDR